MILQVPMFCEGHPSITQKKTHVLVAKLQHSIVDYKKQPAVILAKMHRSPSSHDTSHYPHECVHLRIAAGDSKQNDAKRGWLVRWYRKGYSTVKESSVQMKSIYHAWTFNGNIHRQDQARVDQAKIVHYVHIYIYVYISSYWHLTNSWNAHIIHMIHGTPVFSEKWSYHMLKGLLFWPNPIWYVFPQFTDFWGSYILGWIWWQSSFPNQVVSPMAATFFGPPESVRHCSIRGWQRSGVKHRWKHQPNSHYLKFLQRISSFKVFFVYVKLETQVKSVPSAIFR